MKKASLFFMVLSAFCLFGPVLSGKAFPQEDKGKNREEYDMSINVEGLKLKMSFEGNELVVLMYDTPASREFVSQLPLTLSFEDYAKAEKIAYLPQKLTADGSETPAGDFAYYSPWGNLAIFYKGSGQASGLYIMGEIQSGKTQLADMRREFKGTIEVMR